MKKLAIVFLLVLGSCKRQTGVATTPSPSSDVSLTGGATPREAVDRFMAAAKAGDLQAMSLIWGTSEGPARATMNREEMEMREVIIMRCVRHDSYTIAGESPVAGGNRMLIVDLRYKTLTGSANFTLTKGPGERWYVVDPGTSSLNQICTAR